MRLLLGFALCVFSLSPASAAESNADACAVMRAYLEAHAADRTRSLTFVDADRATEHVAPPPDIPDAVVAETSTSFEEPRQPLGDVVEELRRKGLLDAELEDAFVRAAGREVPIVCDWPEGVVSGRQEDWRAELEIPVWSAQHNIHVVAPTQYAFTDIAFAADRTLALTRFEHHSGDGPSPYGRIGFAVLRRDGAEWRIEYDSTVVYIN